jgi:hypothetical protein
MMNDLYPRPWGAQDRFQAHFIVNTNKNTTELDFLARTRLETKGHFASKKAIGVKWEGGHLADVLNSDDELKNMITKLPYDDAQTYVEPTRDCIRIYGKWKSDYDFVITKELFAMYDRIASHIKRELGSPPVQS